MEVRRSTLPDTNSCSGMEANESSVDSFLLAPLLLISVLGLQVNMYVLRVGKFNLLNFFKFLFFL